MGLSFIPSSVATSSASSSSFFSSTFLARLSSAAISTRRNIPVKFLEAILAELKRDNDDLRAAMQRMLDAEEPYVLDVVVPYSTHVIPFIPAGKTVADMIWKP